MAKQPTRTFIRDEQDSDRKARYVRNMSKNDPGMALKMAQAIAADVTLLKGLMAVVANLAKHEAARNVLLDVFKRPGVKEDYKHAFSVLQKAHIESVLF